MTASNFTRGTWDENRKNFVNEVTGIWAPQLTSPGTYHMTGTQAVAYCRIRYVHG